MIKKSSTILLEHEYKQQTYHLSEALQFRPQGEETAFV